MADGSWCHPVCHCDHTTNGQICTTEMAKSAKRWLQYQFAFEKLQVLQSLAGQKHFSKWTLQIVMCMLMWLTNVRFKIDAMLNAVRICTNCKIYHMMHGKWSFVRTGHSYFRKKSSQCTKDAAINYEIHYETQMQWKKPMIPIKSTYDSITW